MTDEPQYRDPGELPTFDLVDKTMIDVDVTYQRELDPARVKKILTWFSWKSFGALVLAPAADGRYHVTDGQHRLEAAKRHPRIDVVPAIIVQAEGVAEEASVFVGLNKDRRNISALALYHAELAADDPDAKTVQQVCERAGVQMLRYPGSNGKYKPRETVAIGAIRSLVDRLGAMRARQVLDVVAKADLAPITGVQIKAAEILLIDPEFRDEVEPEALTEAIAGRGAMLDAEADAFALTHRMSKGKAMASCWFKRSRKRRKAA